MKTKVKYSLVAICVFCMSLPLFSANSPDIIEEVENTLQEQLIPDYIQQTEDKLDEILELLETKQDTSEGK